jgi:hypothetical protein
MVNLKPGENFMIINQVKKKFSKIFGASKNIGLKLTPKNAITSKLIAPKNLHKNNTLATFLAN